MTPEAYEAVSDAVGGKAPRGVVVVHSLRGGASDGHEPAVQCRLAERIAALKGYQFAGRLDSGQRYPCPIYIVPDDTLVGSYIGELAVRNEHDLFGAVVPYPFVATKAITHPLIGPDAFAPPGWSRQFGEDVRHSVLAGSTAFTREDAYEGGTRLLEAGPVRVKPVRERGGRGQVVVEDAATLEAALDDVHPAVLSHFGIVLEENLPDITTYSVGQLCIDDLVASYVGTQRQTTDNHGRTVYGGSELMVVRGGFETLLARAMPDPARMSIEQARVYDAAAFTSFVDFFASRRNYDVAVGTNAAGERRCGVLEQSWRVGGASGAEIAALELFRADPACGSVRTACFESYGASDPPAPPCTIYFHGVDAEAGPITKYVRVESHGD